MLDTSLLTSIAQQMMSGNTVDVDGKQVAVRRTSRHRLRTVAFPSDEREYQAIEQNVEEPSQRKFYACGKPHRFHAMP